MIIEHSQTPCTIAVHCDKNTIEPAALFLPGMIADVDHLRALLVALEPLRATGQEQFRFQAALYDAAKMLAARVYVATATQWWERNRAADNL